METLSPARTRTRPSPAARRNLASSALRHGARRTRSKSTPVDSIATVGMPQRASQSARPSRSAVKGDGSHSSPRGSRSRAAVANEIVALLRDQARNRAVRAAHLYEEFKRENSHQGWDGLLAPTRPSGPYTIAAARTTLLSVIRPQSGVHTLGSGPRRATALADGYSRSAPNESALLRP